MNRIELRRWKEALRCAQGLHTSRRNWLPQKLPNERGGHYRNWLVNIVNRNSFAQRLIARARQWLIWWNRCSSRFNWRMRPPKWKYTATNKSKRNWGNELTVSANVRWKWRWRVASQNHESRKQITHYYQLVWDYEEANDHDGMRWSTALEFCVGCVLWKKKKKKRGDDRWRRYIEMGCVCNEGSNSLGAGPSVLSPPQH